VRGVSDEGVLAFRGIPFARAGRFEAPLPPQPWEDVFDASTFGPIAPQTPGAQFVAADLPQSEDCLSLNVWTTATGGSPSGRPVLVWIHGGGFTSGSTASPLYDGAALARRGDVVIVSVNYRLGALGFLGHPDLAGPDGLCSNWGLLDNIAALRWVAANIGGFGGDADNVTIFGESAGGGLVALLCASPLASGLFHKAIVQSGAPAAIPLESAARVASDLVAAAGVADVAALRELPLDALLTAQASVIAAAGGRLAVVPVIDGLVLPEAPLAALAGGAAAGVPMLIGTNVDEWKLWAPGDPHSRDLDDDGLRKRIERVLPGHSADVAEVYRDARAARGEPTTPNELWYGVESDRIFRVPAVRVAEAQSGVAPVWMYLFGWRSPAMGGWLGACHGLEIAFVFGNQGRGVLAFFTGEGADADGLSARMADAWLAFARTGSPSTDDLPWPAFDPAARHTMVFDAKCQVEDAPREAERAFVDGLVPTGALSG